MKKRFTNGYKDGSGKGTILFNGKPLFRTHWGCACCDSGPNEQQLNNATELVRLLNEPGIAINIDGRKIK